jgi:low affinity Fe/Cu permease
MGITAVARMARLEPMATRRVVAGGDQVERESCLAYRTARPTSRRPWVKKMSNTRKSANGNTNEAAKPTTPGLKPSPAPSDSRPPERRGIEYYFAPFSAGVSDFAGGHIAFMLAAGLILIWAVFGPITGYSDMWMLVINTSTTIVTFLMVFIIQSSQNRDTRALQVKIDELIRATRGASNSLIDLEQLTPTEIGALHQRYLHLAAKARELGLDFDVGTPEIEESAEKLEKAAGKIERAKAARSAAPNGS